MRYSVKYHSIMSVISCFLHFCLLLSFQNEGSFYDRFFELMNLIHL